MVNVERKMAVQLSVTAGSQQPLRTRHQAAMCDCCSLSQETDKCVCPCALHIRSAVELQHRYVLKQRVYDKGIVHGQCVHSVCVSPNTGIYAHALREGLCQVALLLSVTDVWRCFKSAGFRCVASASV